MDHITPSDNRPSTRAKRFLWPGLLVLGALFALLAWVFASPVGSSPDEDFHLASIWCSNQAQSGLCRDTDNPGTRMVSTQLTRANCYAYAPERSAACQEGIFDPGPYSFVETDRGNFASNYPPLYYQVASVFVSDNVQVSVIAIRILNVLLFVLTFTLLLAGFSTTLRIRVVAGFVITMIPLGAFLVASINPSSWSITFVPAAWLALVGALTTESRRRLALFLGIYCAAAILAAGSRADSGAYVVLGSLAALIGFYTRKTLGKYVLAGVVLLTLVTAVSLFLFTQQIGVISSGLSMPATTAPAVSSDVAEPGGSTLGFNLVQVPELFIGIWGAWGLGWLDTQMPALVWVFGFGLAIAVVVAATHKLQKRALLVSSLLALATYLIPIYVLEKTGVTAGADVQPRYVLPLIIVLFLSILVSEQRGRPVVRSWVGWTLLVVISVATMAIALYVNMRRYIFGESLSGSVNLNSDPSWWWHGFIPPMLVWTLGVIGIAGIGVSLFFYSRENVKKPDFSATEIKSRP